MHPTIHSDAESVKYLIESIKADVRKVKGKILELHEDFVTMGRKLIKLKAMTPHGEWGELVIELKERGEQRIRRAALAVDEGRAPPGLALNTVLKLIASTRDTKVNPDKLSGLTADPPAVDRFDPGPEDPTTGSWIDETPDEQAAHEDPERRVTIPLWKLRELEACPERTRLMTDEIIALKTRIRVLEATSPEEVNQMSQELAMELQVMQSRIDDLTNGLGRANARIKHLLKERGRS